MCSVGTKRRRKERGRAGLKRTEKERMEGLHIEEGMEGSVRKRDGEKRGSVRGTVLSLCHGFGLAPAAPSVLSSDSLFLLLLDQTLTRSPTRQISPPSTEDGAGPGSDVRATAAKTTRSMTLWARTSCL